jgi:hypothetical protein
MALLVSGTLSSEKNEEIGLITKKTLINGYGPDIFNKIKFHLIVGETDFMVPYYADTVKSNFDALSHRPFPILCVMGNNVYTYDVGGKPEVDIGIGETVYQINDKPFAAYLKRGKVYTLDGFKCLVLGGAISYRDKNKELCVTWTEQEKSELSNLLVNNTEFDFVFSQLGPRQISERAYDLFPPDKERDEVAIFNDAINEKIKFRKWICSHYFKDGFWSDKEKAYQYLYESTRIIDRINGRVVFHRENEFVTK